LITSKTAIRKEFTAMRFGCCLNMVATNPDRTGIEHIENLAKYGFDYVELPLAEMMELSDAEFESLKERVSKTGIRCETCNNFFPGTIRLTGDNTDMNQIMDYVQRALARAASLGVQYVVFGSGKAKNVPEGFSLEEGYKQVVALLKKVGPIARNNNITIVIEPLRKAECNLINSFEEGVRLSKDVADDNVKVLVDFYHLTEEKEPVQNIITYGKEFLRHVHMANSHGRVYPESIDEDNYKPFIEALKTIGYEGRVSCEAYVSSYEEQAPRALHFFRANF
jgi:D-psicose/D-tagatose/L-ribulose 3-epimerase